MTRSFSKKGLRRDLNFSDLNNPIRSLNNLLNGLVDIQGESFISEDLDAIRELRTSTMVNDDFRKITESATRVINENGSVEVYKPIIKLKNRFDIAEFTTGDPQFWGGDGLTTRFYESNQINSNNSDPFSGTPVETTVLWEHGRYNYESKINDALLDIYGGVSYTGWFKPTLSGIWSFGINTTGFFTFEFDDGSGNYELLARKSQLEYSFVVNTATAGATSLTLQDPANIKFLLEEDTLINTSIAQFNDPDDPVTITDIDWTNGVIVLSQALEADITTPTAFTFKFSFGDVPGIIGVRTPNLREFENYRIRMRFWVPNETFVTRESVRSIRFSISRPDRLDNDGTYLNYKWLYSEGYNINPTPGTSAYGDFKNYYDNRLNAGGGTIGGGTYNEYQNVLTLNTLNIAYEPPISLSNAIKKTVNLSFENNVDNISLNLTDGIEVGNYVFGTGINAGTRVDDISINIALFINDRTTASGSSVPVTFINHRGLGAFEASATWSSGGTTVSGLSTNTISNIRVGDIVVANGSPKYNTIIQKSASSITTSKAFTASSGSGINGSVFFYRAIGLFNNSLATYCTNVFSGETTALSTSGSNTITIDDNVGISLGQVVQFGARIPAGTTVQNISPSGGDYIITLSNNITDDIPSGQLITFAPAGTTESKEICFPPIDTSPPFTATPQGLQTTTARPSITIAPVSGQGELKFVGLSADGVTVETTTTAATYNRTLTIKDGLGNTYKILASTT